jgi:hypothetical protein
MSVMRFVIFGAVGFGTGWAVAGFFATIAPMWSPYSSYFFAGACGGASLGLALRDWKRVAALALAGLVGFGIGGAITAALRMPFVLLPFAVDFVELQQAPLLLLQHVLVQAMIGLIGGASLGAALGYLEQRRLAEERGPRVR